MTRRPVRLLAALVLSLAILTGCGNVYTDSGGMGGGGGWFGGGGVVVVHHYGPTVIVHHYTPPRVYTRRR